MLDNETLDLGPSPAILQVGVIAFPPDDPETEIRRIDQYLPIQPQLALGRTISFGTIRWWMQQDAKALERFADNEGNDMDELTALVRFRLGATQRRCVGFGVWINHLIKPPESVMAQTPGVLFCCYQSAPSTTKAGESASLAT